MGLSSVSAFIRGSNLVVVRSKRLPKMALTTLTIICSLLYMVSGCIEHDVDYLGDDINACGLKNLNSVYECQAACAANADCKYFTFISPAATRADLSSRIGECCLKNGMGQRKDGSDGTDWATGLQSGPAVCCVENNIDYLGDDINGCTLIVDSASECQAACAENDACSYFTYISQAFTRDPNWRKKCCLKNGQGERKVEADWSTGLQSGPKQCCVENNIDYLGDDINDCTLIVDSASECQAACAENDACSYFTYISQAFTRDPNWRKKCCLKNGQGERKDDAAWSFGLQSGPAICE